jgi:hypothetical protein
MTDGPYDRDPERINALAHDLLDWLTRHRCEPQDGFEVLAIVLAGMIKSMAHRGLLDEEEGIRLISQTIAENVSRIKIQGSLK